MKVACPTCKKNNEWSEKNQFRPFCCERCKLIDLGEWANESRTIPGTPSIEAFESIDELNPELDEGIPPEDRLH
ncbi:DNA gyrase inhibitor YacG [Gammaproteobacteria bacterium 42_54_T18]|nr:DNA gyrase inhibitor YacG [Gammaproteobacteria bacterium 42_54_T18]